MEERTYFIFCSPSIDESDDDAIEEKKIDKDLIFKNIKEKFDKTLKRILCIPGETNKGGEKCSGCIIEGKCIYNAFSFLGEKKFGSIEILPSTGKEDLKLKVVGDAKRGANRFVVYYLHAINSILEKLNPSMKIKSAEVEVIRNEKFTFYDGKEYYNDTPSERLKKELEKELEEKIKKQNELEKKINFIEREKVEKTREINSLRQQLEQKSAELAEVRREQQTKEEIAKEMAKALAARSELVLANLKLAVIKSVNDIYKITKFRSRKIAKILADLEAAIDSPLKDEDYDEDDN